MNYLDGTCWCGPTFELVRSETSAGWVIVHHNHTAARVVEGIAADLAERCAASFRRWHPKEGK